MMSYPLPNAAALRSPREVWLDVAKGIGIILVVFGHTLSGLISADILQKSHAWVSLYYFIYTFHMPLFFFLAGLTVTQSLQKGAPDFIWAKLVTVAYPYVVWSLIQGLSQLVASNSLNQPFKVEYLYGIYLYPIGHFWFFYAIFAFHMLAALFRNKPALFLAFSGFAFVAHNYFDFSPAVVLHQICHYLVFFAAGVLLRSQSSVHAGLPMPTFSAGGCALLLCAIGSILVGPIVDWAYMNPLILPLSALGIFGVIRLSAMPEPWQLTQMLAFLGRRSLSIFVMHVMACAGTRIFLVKFTGFSDPMPLLLTCTLAGIVLPLIAHDVIARFGLLSVFGLERARQRADASQPVA